MDKIKLIPNFPSPGINFRHIGPLLADPHAFHDAIQSLIESLGPIRIDTIGGLDARGFFVSTAMQAILKKPQFMIRKASKLPGEKYSASYLMEYGEQKVVEIEKDAIQPGQHVLLVDDLLATGGTLAAAIDLVKQAGGVVAGIACIIGLDGLDNKARLQSIVPGLVVRTLFNYPSNSDTVIARMDPTIQEYRPSKPIYREPGRPILMWHPTMETMAQRVLNVSNYQPSYVDWSTFSDGWSNITFEPSLTLMNQDVTVLFSMADKEHFAEQLCLCVALPRQLIRSLTVIIPYLGPGTHERVDKSGMLATVEPMVKIISNSIPHTKSGPAVIRVVDIHALPIRFYFTDNVIPKLMTVIPVLQKEIRVRQTIAFPDDGAFKRFKHYFEGNPTVICGKMRGEGDKRTITIQNRLNWPTDSKVESECMESVLMVDDLVQSGGTLLTCAKALKEQGFKHVSAYVTHAVFPRDSWKKFVGNPYVDTFYVTNTNPQVTDALVGVSPFRVLSIEKHLVDEIHRDVESVCYSPSTNAFPNVYVASTNVQKLEAVSLAFPHPYRVYGVDGLSSGVPEQPFGWEETEKGATNRLKALMNELNSTQIVMNPTDGIFVAVENGIIEDEADCSFEDIAVVAVCVHGDEHVLYSQRVRVPEQTVHLVKEAIETKVTYGSLVEAAYGLSKGTWHEYLGGGNRITRVEQIQTALDKLVDVLKV